MYIPLRRAVVAWLYKSGTRGASVEEIASSLRGLYYSGSVEMEYPDREKIEEILATMHLLGYASNGGDRYTLKKERMPRRYVERVLQPVLSLIEEGDRV